jgi:hypothetical protein
VSGTSGLASVDPIRFIVSGPRPSDFTVVGPSSQQFAVVGGGRLPMLATLEELP